MNRVRFYPVVLCLLVAGVMSQGDLLAQEPVPEDDFQGVSHGESEEHSGTHHHKNHIGLFVGVTDEEAETAFTLGLDYERRLSKRFGIGLLVDNAFGDVRAFIVAVPVFFYPTERLKLVLAAGYEDADAEDRETIIRAGVEYEFPLGRMTLSPTFNVDFVENEEIYVYGITLGRGF